MNKNGEPLCTMFLHLCHVCIEHVGRWGTNFKDGLASPIIPQISRVLEPDRTTVRSLFADLNFSGTSMSFPFICRNFHSTFKGFGFLACQKNLSACSREIWRFDLFFLFPFSDVTSASGLLMRFFCVDCEGVDVGVFFGVNVGV